MNSIISFYPVLNNEIIEKLHPKIKCCFYFEKNNNEFELKYDEINDVISINVKDNDWNTYEYDLYMNINVFLENIELLYGEMGIAPKKSELAICAECYSKKSRIRMCSNICSLEESKNTNNFTLKLIFEKNTFENPIDINLLIFLNKGAPNVLPEEIHLNNSPGVTLGNIFKRTLMLTGSGSLFPIYSSPMNDSKLWKFTLDYSDPENESFINCAKLEFNTKHKDYKYIDVNNKEYCDRLVLEIICNCLFMTFSKLKEDGYLNKIDSSYKDGSIMNLISYYKDTLGINFSSIQSIYDSLQTYANKR